MFEQGHILIMELVILLVRLSYSKTLDASREDERRLNNVGKTGNGNVSNMKVKFSLQNTETSQNRQENEERVNEGSHFQNFSYYTFQDAFECFPCICFRDESQIITAECSSRSLQGPPNNLPITIRSLNMTDSSMKEFNTASVGMYLQMTSLAVTYHQWLARVTLHSSVNTSIKLKILDLGHNNISSIQNGSFLYYGHLRELLLGFNKIINITANMFNGLNNLKMLNLTHNKIRSLQVDTFSYLESLEFLDLSKNVLNYNAKSIPLLLFEKLGHLRHIYLQGNVGNSQPYPNEALSKLIGLTHLFLDVTVGSKLGPPIKSLKNLTSLTLGGKPGYCNLRNITSDFLENVPYLTTFILYGCQLLHIDKSVYNKVEKLETLEIRKTVPTYDLDEAFDHLQGLVNSSLKILRLISLSNTSSYFCRALGKVHAKYLHHIALEELDLSQNLITLLGYDFVSLLPKTLKRLVLMDNKLTTKVFSITSFTFLTELTEIYLDRQNMQTYETGEFGDYNDEMNSYDLGLSNADANFYDRNKAAHYDDFNCVTESSIRKVSSCLKMWPDPHETVNKKKKIPPFLKIVRGSRFYGFDNVMLESDWKKNNSLTDISFTNNFLVSWGSGVLPLKLQKVDLSHNYCMKLKEGFFQPNNSLIFLNISNNILGESFAADTKGKIFALAVNLRILDVSMNLIDKLPRNLFIGLKSLEVLLVSNNKVRSLNLSLSHMHNLRLMNFSRNSISWIDKATRDDLDILAASKVVYLDLTFNPLPCNCDGVEVLYWMANTNVKFINQMYLKCQTESGEMSTFGDLRKRAQQVQRLCASRAIVLVISVSFSVCIVLLVSLALLYRYRWKLRYLRNIAIAKIGGFKPNYVMEENFQYDAYILYEDKTIGFVFRDCIQELEVKRGHRLLLADRDIMPGSYMTSAILSAVQNSYKTIPIFTPDFYNGAYSEYAVKMAVMEEIYGPRQILHVCLLQPAGTEDMSKDLLSIMHRNHYTEYPPDEELTDELIDHFWNQLSDSIRQMG